MNDQWQDITDDHRNGWYWCEALNEDSPPQLLRSHLPLIWDSSSGRFVVNLERRMVWERWTTGGWVPLVGRVCPISPRPQ